MAKKKVVVKRKHRSSQSVTKPPIHAADNESFDFIDDIDGLNLDLDSVEEKEEEHIGPNGKKLHQSEQKIEQLNERQEKQSEFLNKFVAFIVNYCTGLITLGIISFVCIYMLSYLSKISDANPSFSSYIPIITGLIIVIWACLIIAEIIRMHQRHKQKEK